MRSILPQTAHYQRWMLVSGGGIRSGGEEVARTQIASQPVSRYHSRHIERNGRNRARSAPCSKHDRGWQARHEIVSLPRSQGRHHVHVWRTEEKSNIPFLTQLAHGNTREHLGEGDEKGVDQCSALARALACATRDRGGGVPGLTHLSFNLEGVDLVSRAMKPRVRDGLDCTFCTLRKTALHSFVLGLEWGSGLHCSGFAALSWQVVEVEGGCGQEGELAADGGVGANPQYRFVSDTGPRLMSGRAYGPPTALTSKSSYDPWLDLYYRL